LVRSLFKKCIKERRIAYSWLNFFLFIKIGTGTFFLFRILFASLFSSLQKAQSKTASQMAPIDEFRSYEHYLQARQAVGECAVNSLTPTQALFCKI
jgi:hypothetical protein